MGASMTSKISVRQIVAVSIGEEATEESGALKRSVEQGNCTLDNVLFVVHSNKLLELEIKPGQPVTAEEFRQWMVLHACLESISMPMPNKMRRKKLGGEVDGL